MPGYITYLPRSRYLARFFLGAQVVSGWPGTWIAPAVFPRLDEWVSHSSRNIRDIKTDYRDYCGGGVVVVVV
jgi:hypothetical protein